MSDPGRASLELPQLGLHHLQALSASWLRRLAGEAGWDVSQTGLQMWPFVVGPQDGLHISIDPLESAPWIAATSSDPSRQEEVDALVVRCGALTSAATATAEGLGGYVWYQCSLQTEQLNLADPLFQSRMQERLYSTTHITGWRRLGEGLLLNFNEAAPEGDGPPSDLAMFRPPTTVDVYMALGGPIDGPFTRPAVQAMGEVTAAICTFALGRPVDLPPTIWPVSSDMLPELESRMADPSILTLARHGRPLDIFGLANEDRMSWDRVRGALLSYDAALRAQREQVAVILYVVAAECLTNPFQPWKTERLTTRFIKFFDDLMPEHLDEMVQHDNFEQAFGIVRGVKQPKTLRRNLLGNLYGFRSEPVHEGLAMAYEGMSLAGAAGQRRMLALWFAEWAILHYLESRRTSLIGHRVTDPDFEIPETLDGVSRYFSEYRGMAGGALPPVDVWGGAIDRTLKRQPVTISGEPGGAVGWFGD
ncbi:hypothetical protein [Mycolicibacterium vinylchloridicum]|uniref:hypothetical protein n=1 Tax=Mycolicibacterium vinylchloridicum TaxID=2736928 RepID=UPI0015CDB69D|nr:hypothetical protein [Mycolicibacterium vinylchloridicum]